jgi:hypothetical protein
MGFHGRVFTYRMKTTHIKIGTVFGKLKTISESYPIEVRQRNLYYVDAICECGKKIQVIKSKLVSGHTRSCGCLVTINRYVKHGQARQSGKERLYNIWTGIKTRCYDVNHRSYYYYGNKGIRLYKEWLDYSIFNTWSINNGYKDSLSLDRIDPNKDYEPSNCRWISREENSSRISRLIIRDDGIIYKSAKELSELTEYSYSGIRASIENKRTIHGHNYYWYEVQGPLTTRCP